MSEVKNLKNTLKIDNEEYNITAVHSDSASKVDNKLTIYKMEYVNATPVEFDGASAKSLEVVPATGGTYNGPVMIENNDLSSAQPKQVLTYSNVEQLTEQLTGFSCYYWDGSDLTSIKKDSDEALGKASLIVGPEKSLASLANYVTNNQIDGMPVYWLYISDESPYSIFLCTVDESIKLGLTSEKLVSPDNSANHYEFTAEELYNRFSSLTSADDNLRTALNNLKSVVDSISGSSTVIINLVEISNILEQNKQQIENIVNGKTVVAKATNASYATEATKATKAVSDNTTYSYSIDKGYYRSTANQATAYNTYANTITISTTEPPTNSGNPGDIWIKIPSA